MNLKGDEIQTNFVYVGQFGKNEVLTPLAISIPAFTKTAVVVDAMSTHRRPISVRQMFNSYNTSSMHLAG